MVFTRVITFFLLTFIGLTNGAKKNNVKNCSMPLNVTGITLDPARMGGTWYEYMHKTDNIDDYNIFTVYTPLGMTNSVSKEIPMNGTMTIYTKMPGATQLSCMVVYVLANFTTTGNKNAQLWLPMPGMAPPNQIFKTIYTDYTTLEIVYKCYTPNLATGICDQDGFFINTRVKPTLLTKQAKNYIKAVLDYYLAPCYSAKNMKVTAFVPDNQLPVCNQPPPADFTQMVQSATPNKEKG